MGAEFLTRLRRRGRFLLLIQCDFREGIIFYGELVHEVKDGIGRVDAYGGVQVVFFDDDMRGDEFHDLGQGLFGELEFEISRR